MPNEPARLILGGISKPKIKFISPFYARKLFFGPMFFIMLWPAVFAAIFVIH